MEIGQLIKFAVPSLHGKSVVAGTITRIFKDGRIEIRAQLGGYYTISKNEIICGQHLN